MGRYILLNTPTTISIEVLPALKSHTPTLLNYANKHGDIHPWWEHSSYDGRDVHHPSHRYGLHLATGTMCHRFKMGIPIY